MKKYHAVVIPLILLLMSCALTRSPMMNAARKGDDTQLKNLIASGSSINERDGSGRTPLIHAVLENRIQTVKLLIEMGADQKIRDNATWDALSHALNYGYFDIAKLLIDHGADIESKDKQGMTAFLHASQSGNVDIVKYLINKGANINARDVSGEAPLLLAAAAFDKDTVSLLIENGADVNVKNNSGMTPLLYVASQNYDKRDQRGNEIARLLLEKGCDIKARDKNNYSALHYGLYSMNEELVALIRKYTDEKEALSFDETLKGPSRYIPEKGMFEIPTGREKNYEIAVDDCNILVTPFKTGLLIGGGPVLYMVGLAVDQVTVPAKFQKCMARMGFPCVKNCSQ